MTKKPCITKGSGCDYQYLTVRRGNTVENTNHSWSEVNQYSAYDYEKMGVKRYQVEGLLQVGNEKDLSQDSSVLEKKFPMLRFRSVGRALVEPVKRIIRLR